MRRSHRLLLATGAAVVLLVSLHAVLVSRRRREQPASRGDRLRRFVAHPPFSGNNDDDDDGEKTKKTEKQMENAGRKGHENKNDVVGAALHPSRVHVAFSTDCGPAMRWQSFALFDSAARVGQRGAMTRLVSGCDATQRGRVEAEHRALAPTYPFRSYVHFTRDFNRDFNASTRGARFRFANKPNALLHWLDHHGDAFRDAHGHADEDVVVALIDPDFVFLRPLDLPAL